jgi:hypothetical protein
MPLRRPELKAKPTALTFLTARRAEPVTCIVRALFLRYACWSSLGDLPK